MVGSLKCFRNEWLIQGCVVIHINIELPCFVQVYGVIEIIQNYLVLTNLLGHRNNYTPPPLQNRVLEGYTVFSLSMIPSFCHSMIIFSSTARSAKELL